MSQLVTLWTPPLTRRAYRLTRDHDGTNEVIQESWIGIAKGLRSLRDPSRFGAWSFRIVHHKASDWIRERSSIRKMNSTLREGTRSAADPETDHYDAIDLRIAVSMLDPKLREVVYLFYMDHCTIQQIAAVLNIPVGTAKTRLARAKALLKPMLERSTT